MVEETGALKENHRPLAKQTLGHSATMGLFSFIKNKINFQNKWGNQSVYLELPKKKPSFSNIIETDFTYQWYKYGMDIQ